jgi:putative nucleotidyltransferase with HDIG domain
MESYVQIQTLSPREALLAEADKLRLIPALKITLDKAVQVLADDNASFHDLFNVMRYDQAITFKIISVANSAYCARGSQIVSLEGAMMAIGFDETRRIVMCQVFLGEMLSRWKLSRDDLASLWTHTLSVACAARMLAEKTMVEDGEKVFTASILHDIGKIPFFMYGDRYREIREEAHYAGRDICSIEREAFGIDHAELGHFMSVKFSFPNSFSEVIRGHHGGLETIDRIVDIVMKADKFIENPEVDIGPEGIILREEADRINTERTRVAGLLGMV